MNDKVTRENAEYYGKLAKRALRLGSIEDVYNLATIAARSARRLRLAPRNGEK